MWFGCRSDRGVRLDSLSPLSVIHLHLIPNSADGFYLETAVYGVQAATEEVDVVVQVAVFYIRFQAPDAGEKKGSGEYLAWISEKHLHQGTFPLGQGAFLRPFKIGRAHV